MDRQQLILAIAATLLGTFLAGWFAGWLVRRVAGTGRPRQAAMEAARIGHQDAEAMLAAELAAGRDDLARARAALTAAQAEIDELRNHVDRELAHGGEPADRNSRTDQRKEHLHDGESDRREGAGRRTA